MTRHPANATRGARASRLARRLGAATVATGGAVLVAVLAAGGTYALWDGSRQVEPGTISTGNTGLTINSSTSYGIAGLDVTALFPGRSVITATPLTVQNTGTTPLVVTPGAVTFSNPSSPLASELNVAVKHSAVCTATPVGSTPASFTSFTLQPGATSTVCVEVQLKATAPANVQGISLGFTATLVGTQVRP
jgi:hypothetical protein